MLRAGGGFARCCHPTGGNDAAGDGGRCRGVALALATGPARRHHQTWLGRVPWDSHTIQRTPALHPTRSRPRTDPPPTSLPSRPGPSPASRSPSCSSRSAATCTRRPRSRRPPTWASAPTTRCAGGRAGGGGRAAGRVRTIPNKRQETERRMTGQANLKRRLYLSGTVTVKADVGQGGGSGWTDGTGGQAR